MRVQTVLLLVCVAGTALAWNPYRMRGSVRDQELELEALLNAYLRSTDPTVVDKPEGNESGDENNGNPDENKPGETKPGENKPDGTKPEGNKPMGQKPEGPKPGQTKPGDNRPMGSKPDESKQGGSKPIGVKGPYGITSNIEPSVAKQPVTNSDDSSSSEDHDLECSTVQPPCEFDTGSDGSEFYECAFSELMNAEDAINNLVKETFDDKGVFSDKEMEIVRDLRSDWKVSMQLKEVVEIVFMELAEARLYQYDWESADSESAQQVEAMVCEYLWLRDQTFEKGVFHKDQ